MDQLNYPSASEIAFISGLNVNDHDDVRMFSSLYNLFVTLFEPE